MFGEFLSINEFPALRLGHTLIYLIATGLAKMGFIPAALWQSSQSPGGDGLSTFELTRLHFFVTHLFEFGTEGDVHQVTSPRMYSMTIIGLDRIKTVDRQDRGKPAGPAQCLLRRQGSKFRSKGAWIGSGFS